MQLENIPATNTVPLQDKKNFGNRCTLVSNKILAKVGKQNMSAVTVLFGEKLSMGFIRP